MLRDGGPAPRQEALSSQENAAEERQTHGIPQCQANIVANEHRKRADESLIEGTEGCRKFRRKTDPLVPKLLLANAPA